MACSTGLRASLCTQSSTTNAVGWLAGQASAEAGAHRASEHKHAGAVGWLAGKGPAEQQAQGPGGKLMQMRAAALSCWGGPATLVVTVVRNNRESTIDVAIWCLCFATLHSCMLQGTP